MVNPFRAIATFFGTICLEAVWGEYTVLTGSRSCSLKTGGWFFGIVLGDGVVRDTQHVTPRSKIVVFGPKSNSYVRQGVSYTHTSFL